MGDIMSDGRYSPGESYHYPLIVKKLLDTPTNRLRAQANTPAAPEYADVARTLFGLSTGD